MKQSKWYTLASYLFEWPVEKRHSPFSGELTVTFHRGQYKLSTREAIYSFGKHYTSFSIPFRALEIRHQPIHQVLALGFGLGSVVNLLEGNPAVERIVAVDADPVMLELAQKYLGGVHAEKVQYIVDDAAAFLARNKMQYDLILFDVFIGDRTPSVFLDESILNQLKEAMAANGCLLFSKLDMTAAVQAENAGFGKTFSKVFPKGFTIEADGNKIFCARS